MLVFNLTDAPLHYRKRVLPPEGGSHDFPELDDYIPESDKKLERKKVIGVGAIPRWWTTQKKLKEEARRAAEAAKEVEKVEVKTEVKVEDSMSISLKAPDAKASDKPLGLKEISKKK